MITFAEVDTLLRSAQPVLAATLYPAAGLLAVVFGSEAHRLGADTQHDLADYFPPVVEAAPVRERRRLRREPSQTPIHDRLAAEPMPDVVARRIANQWLEDIAAVEQAKAGIRPAWASAERDLTGAFPVVRAA